MPRKRTDPAERKALQTMRNLLAKGITSQEELTRLAAEALNNDEASKMVAQRVYDREIKIMEAN